MIASNDLVGLAVDVVEFDVERGKVREFARATHTADSVHVDREVAKTAGFATEPATATHVVVAGHYRDQQAFVERLGLAIERVVVGSVRWDYERALVAGDSLRGDRTVVADEIRESRRGPMRIVTLETDYRDQLGTPVVRVREELIERGVS